MIRTLAAGTVAALAFTLGATLGPATSLADDETPAPDPTSPVQLEPAPEPYSCTVVDVHRTWEARRYLGRAALGPYRRVRVTTTLCTDGEYSTRIRFGHWRKRIPGVWF